MTNPTALTAEHAAALVAPWRLAVRAEHKSLATITVYTSGVQTYLTWCTQHRVAP